MTNTAPPPPIALLVSAGTQRRGTLAEVLEEFGQRLADAHVFALPDQDARLVAITVAQLAVYADDGAEAMRERAAAVRDGWWAGWSAEPAAVASAFDVAADVLDTL